MICENKDIAVFTSFIKLTNSITVELISGNDLYLDKKGFKWEIKKYDETGISLKVKFDHPKYISVGDPDTLHI